MRIAIAVIVGFIGWTVVFLGGNQGATAAMPDKFADDGSTSSVTALLLILAISVLASVGGGWLSAKIAKAANNKPAKILGVLLLIVGIAVQASYWNAVPLWYNLLFLGFLFPAAVFGGRLVSTTS